MSRSRDPVAIVDAVLSGRLSAEETLRLLLQRNTRRRRVHAMPAEPPPEKSEWYDWKADEYITESEYNRRFPTKG